MTTPIASRMAVLLFTDLVGHCGSRARWASSGSRRRSGGTTRSLRDAERVRAAVRREQVWRTLAGVGFTVSGIVALLLLVRSCG